MDDNHVQTKLRVYKLIRSGLIVLLIGIAYYLFVYYTGFGIPCVFKLVTGKYCPGCGISRMFMALFAGDLMSAVKYNLLVMIFMVFGSVPTAIYVVRYIKSGNNELSVVEKIGIVIAFIFTLAFWIMRNTEEFMWLAPMGN